MATKGAPQDPVAELDRWFSNRCDGTWEHHWGVSIQTTDNPGWLLTFKSLPIDRKCIPSAISKLLRDYGAEVVVTDTVVRVFCRSLRGCLDAAAELLLLETNQRNSGK